MINFSYALCLRYLQDDGFLYVLMLIAWTNIIMRAVLRWCFGGKNYANN